jgi:hypothetical protein
MEKFHKPNLISTTSTWEKFPNVLGEHLTVCFRVILFNNKLRIFFGRLYFLGSKFANSSTSQFLFKTKNKNKNENPCKFQIPKNNYPNYSQVKFPEEITFE